MAIQDHKQRADAEDRPTQHQEEDWKKKVVVDRTQPAETNHQCHEAGPRMERPRKTKTRLTSAVVSSRVSKEA